MIYFLYGDTPLPIKYEELLKEIKGKNPEAEVKYFDGIQKEEESFFEAVSTNSMFSPLEILVYKRLEKLNLKKFFDRLSNFNLSQKIVVLLYEEFLNEYDKETNPIDKKDMKKIEEMGKVIAAKKKNEKKAMIFYTSRELEIDERKAEKICEMVGDDFFKLKQEIEKIKNYMGDEEFSLEAAEKIISVTDEYSLRKSIERLVESKDIKDILNFLREKREYMLFLYSLYEELNMLLKLKVLERRGTIAGNMSYRYFKENVYGDAKEYFRRDRGGYHSDYPVFLKFKLLNKYSIEFLKSRMENIIYTEYDIKSGKIPEEAGVERFILGFFEGEE